MLITNLANDPAGVTLKETMFAARHKTAAASATYQKNSSISESARVNSLLSGVSTDKTPLDSTSQVDGPLASNELVENYAQSVKSDSDLESVEETVVPLPTLNVVEEVSSHESVSSERPPMYTQVQMNFLEEEMTAVQNGRITAARSPPITMARASRPCRTSYSSRADTRVHNDWIASRRAGVALRGNGRTNYRHHGNYVNAARNPYRNPYSMPRNRAPSSRELEIVSMRHRLAELRRQDNNHRSYGSPYDDDLEESDALYNDCLDHY